MVKGLKISKEQDKLLHKIWYTPSEPGSYMGVHKFYSALQNHEILNKIPRYQLQLWLYRQEAYSVHRETRSKFKRSRYLFSYLNEYWHADLTDLYQYRDSNQGMGYILVTVDLLSRQACFEPAKSKSSVDMQKAFDKVFARRELCQFLLTDLGVEFKSQSMKAYFRDKGIKQIFSNNTHHGAFVEVLQRYLKKRLFTYFYQNLTFKWVDVISDFEKSYNSTKHTTTKLIPDQVTPDNQWIAFKNHFLSKYLKPKVSKPLSTQPKKKKWTTGRRFKYQINSIVRIGGTKSPFTKSYFEHFSTALYQIIDRYKRDGIPYYRVKEAYPPSDIIEGSFYETQLLGVPPDIKDQSLFRIDKILARKQRNRKKYVQVSYLGYNDKYNEWILESKVKNLKTLTQPKRKKRKS